MARIRLSWGRRLKKRVALGPCTDLTQGSLQTVRSCTAIRVQGQQGGHYKLKGGHQTHTSRIRGKNEGRK